MDITRALAIMAKWHVPAEEIEGLRRAAEKLPTTMATPPDGPLSYEEIANLLEAVGNGPINVIYREKEVTNKLEPHFETNLFGIGGNKKKSGLKQQLGSNGKANA